MRLTSTWPRALLTGLLLLGVATQTPAQQQDGNLFATVTDSQGGALPGVLVEVTGIGAPRRAFSDDDGQVRFLGLDPGNYQMTMSLENFSTVDYPSIDIRVGRNTDISVTLQLAAVDDVITVTAETPLLDERKIARGTTITRIELEKIPTARDPWAIVTQTPGVLSDRINVGGNESGQQSTFIAPGSSADENAFLVDGVNITDLNAVGSSPSYYDFDQFEEMQISTGGSDIEKVNAGTSLNLVTKRGSNTPRGSARFMLTDSDEQFGIFNQGSIDIADELAPGQNLTGTPGNSINEILDFGAETGGPVKKDVVWFWGSYGRNDVKQFQQNGNADDTLLENTALKVNAQLGSANSVVTSWNRGDKLKFGRRDASNLSAAASRNQDGPTEVWKIEDTHVFNSSLYLTGLFSYVDGGFQLQSQGGAFGDLSAPQPVLDVNGIWVNSWYSGGSDRNTDNFQIDGSYFFDSGQINHELSFGTSFRKFESDTAFGWPGQNIASLTCEGLGLCGVLTGLGFNGDDVVVATRSGTQAVEQEYSAVWAQDTLSKGNWTLNVGLRLDMQEGTNAAGGAPANPAFPDVLPSLDFPGNSGGFDWSTISPRIGYTYALGEDRDTLLRASFARFAEQLQTADISRVNPVSNAAASFTFADLNSNDQWDAGEPTQLLGFAGFDPAKPKTLLSPNETDPGLDPSITDELIASIEHAFLPQFVAGLELTYRRTQDILENRVFINDGGVRRLQERSDFVLDQTITGTIPVTGQPFSADFYSWRPGITQAAGNLLTNGDRETEYLGLSLTATKRLSNRWMLRGFLQFGEGEWKDGPDSDRFDSPNLLPNGSDTDGQLFLVQSAGSGPFQDVFIQSSWSANVNGLYQVAPDKSWGFNLAADIYAREGYPLPYTFATTGSDGQNRIVRVFSDTDEIRADDILTANFRIEKDIPFSSSLSGTLSLDAFNLMNENYVLQRDRTLNAPTADFLAQSLAPRIYRLGFRLSFR